MGNLSIGFVVCQILGDTIFPHSAGPLTFSFAWMGRSGRKGRLIFLCFDIIFCVYSFFIPEFLYLALPVIHNHNPVLASEPLSLPIPYRCIISYL